MPINRGGGGVVVTQPQAGSTSTVTVVTGTDNGTNNWQRGQVNVDQKTPWDTTGSNNILTTQQPPLQQQADWNPNSGVGNNNIANGGSSGNGSWGQPAAVGIPPRVGTNNNSSNNGINFINN